MYYFQPRYGLGVYLAFNRNEYSEFPWGGGGMAVGTSPSVSRVYRKCESLDVSQCYEPPRPVTGISLPFCSLLNEKYSENCCNQ
jgi:hypothetical protein